MNEDNEVNEIRGSNVDESIKSMKLIRQTRVIEVNERQCLSIESVDSKLMKHARAKLK